MVDTIEIFLTIFTAYLVFDVQWKLKIERRLSWVEALYRKNGTDMYKDRAGDIRAVRTVSEASR